MIRAPWQHQLFLMNTDCVWMHERSHAPHKHNDRGAIHFHCKVHGIPRTYIYMYVMINFVINFMINFTVNWINLDSMINFKANEREVESRTERAPIPAVCHPVTQSPRCTAKNAVVVLVYACRVYGFFLCLLIYRRNTQYNHGWQKSRPRSIDGVIFLYISAAESVCSR